EEAPVDRRRPEGLVTLYDGRSAVAMLVRKHAIQTTRRARMTVSGFSCPTKGAAILIAALVAAVTTASAQSVKGVRTELGCVLADQDGMTLYSFEGDKGTTVSHCTGWCLDAWPPYYAETGAEAE